jgi:hypothetical protein
VNYLLWPNGARSESPPLYELRRAELVRDGESGEPRLTGEFRSPAFPEVLDHRWISFGSFSLSDYIAIPWVAA